MKEESAKETNSGKRPYTKPAVAKVPLIPEEAVLAACKSGTARGPGQSPRCNKKLPVCSSIGS